MVVLVACTTDESAPPDGSMGVDAGNDAPVSYAPCPTCCDPVNQTGCGSGEGCYMTYDGNDVFCALAGAQDRDQMCSPIYNGPASACAPGSWCASGSGTCKALFCAPELPTPNACTSACQPTYTKYGLAPFGLCS